MNIRMIPIKEIKSIDRENSEADLCPYKMNNTGNCACETNQCMAWYWTGEDSGCCALIYRPEHISIDGDGEAGVLALRD